MNKIDVYALCVKIMLFLNKNSCLSKSNLLYFISLSDFYVDGSMQNNNIKNINSFNCILTIRIIYMKIPAVSKIINLDLK